MLRCFDKPPLKGKLRANLGHPPKLLLEVSSDKGLVGRSFNTPPGVGRVESFVIVQRWTIIPGFNTPPGVGRVESPQIGKNMNRTIPFQHPSRSGAG